MLGKILRRPQYKPKTEKETEVQVPEKEAEKP
jgi:hypothetical protein